MDKLQMDCVAHWKPYMEHVHTGFSDATVYESYIEYPTDAKLLWKSCCEVLQMIDFRTLRINEAVRLIYRIGKGFSNIKKGTKGIFLPMSPMVKL